MKKVLLIVTGLFFLGLSYLFVWAYAFNYGIEVSENAPVPLTANQVELWDLVQDWRHVGNRDPYVLDKGLCLVAQTRLEETKTQWGHENFSDDLEYYTVRLGLRYIGENLARGQQTENEVLSDWLDSPVHRQMLENTFYTHSCIRCSDNYCVQIFGGY